MTALDKITEILTVLAASEDVPMGAVYYGMCPENSLDTWNYFVFNRVETSKAGNRLDYQTRYAIHIIHEDYIPEGYVQTVIDALQAADDGFLIRADSSPVTYDYILKGSTNVVIELATINVFVPEKRSGD